jgi:hypothetical protein
LLQGSFDSKEAIMARNIKRAERPARDPTVWLLLVM